MRGLTYCLTFTGSLPTTVSSSKDLELKQLDVSSLTSTNAVMPLPQADNESIGKPLLSLLSTQRWSKLLKFRTWWLFVTVCTIVQFVQFPQFTFCTLTGLNSVQILFCFCGPLLWSKSFWVHLREKLKVMRPHTVHSQDSISGSKALVLCIGVI